MQFAVEPPKGADSSFVQAELRNRARVSLRVCTNYAIRVREVLREGRAVTRYRNLVQHPDFALPQNRWLGPGERMRFLLSFDWEDPRDINYVFSYDLSQPGRYRAQFEYSCRRGVGAWYARSNRIDFEVLPRRGPPPATLGVQ